MNLSIILFLIGILGFILNRKNIILLIISIEMMLLAVNQANIIYFYCFITTTITYLIAFLYLENVLNIPLENFNLEFYSITALACSGVVIKPWQVTGLADGDGSFQLSILQNKQKNGWLVVPSFIITAGKNPENYKMLTDVNNFFEQKGHILNTQNGYNFRIMGFKNCLMVKSHFTHFPLMTYKSVYFNLWSEVLNLMEIKEHLTESGLNKILAIKFSFKYGANSKLQTLFPNIAPMTPPAYNPPLHLINTNWLSGFMIADGSFGIQITKKQYVSKSSGAVLRDYYSVITQVRIYQDDISLIVLEAIKNMLSLGKLVKPGVNRTVSSLVFADKSSISSIIEIFKENPLFGSKQLDFLDFCKGFELYCQQAHLDPVRVKELISIVEGMNTKRKFN